MGPPPASFLASFESGNSHLVGIVKIADAVGLNVYLGHREADRYFAEVQRQTSLCAAENHAIWWRASGAAWALAGPFGTARLDALAASLTGTHIVNVPWRRSVIAKGIVKRDAGLRRTRVTCAVRACFGMISATAPEAVLSALAELIPRADLGPLARAIDSAEAPQSRARWSCAEPLEPLNFTCPFCAHNEPQSPSFSYPDRCSGCDARLVY